MTQACDLEHAKVASVVLGPHYGLGEFKAAWMKISKARDRTRRPKPGGRYCDDICEGTIWNLNLLNAQSGDGVELEHRLCGFP